jgi:hypothetical protein
MTKPMIRIHDIETNEVIDREMTDAEFEDYQELQAKTEADKAALVKAEADKAALLIKLGITAEEAKLLLS